MAQHYKIVPDNAMFEAFAKGKSSGYYQKDEVRFNEFQRGWKEALEWVNTHAVYSVNSTNKSSETDNG